MLIFAIVRIVVSLIVIVKDQIGQAQIASVMSKSNLTKKYHLTFLSCFQDYKFHSNGLKVEMNKIFATVDILPSNATHVGAVTMKILRKFVSFSLRFQFIWDKTNQVFRNNSFNIEGCSLHGNKKNQFHYVTKTINYISSYYNLKILKCPLLPKEYLIRNSQKNPEITFSFIDLIPKKFECQVIVNLRGKLTKDSNKVETVGRFIESFLILRLEN